MPQVTKSQRMNGEDADREIKKRKATRDRKWKGKSPEKRESNDCRASTGLSVHSDVTSTEVLKGCNKGNTKKQRDLGMKEIVRIQGTSEEDKKGKSPGKLRKRESHDSGVSAGPNVTSERTEVLKELKALLRNAPVSSVVWAGCQIGDLAAIKKLVATTKVNDMYIELLERPLSSVPLKWAQRFQDSTFKPAQKGRNSDGQPWVTRSSVVKNLCLERDKNKCVLTKGGVPQVAHIFSYCMLNTRQQQSNLVKAVPTLWSLLTVFWDKERIDSWKKTIPRILIRASRNALTSFVWLQLCIHCGTMACRGSCRSACDAGIIATSQGLENAGDEAYFLFRWEDGAGRLIRSGDVFKFTTTDPDKLPLPSVELLDMQWNLHRLLRLSGAAGWPQTDSDDDSDDILPAAYGYANTNTYKWIPRPASLNSFVKQSY
ncbi:hypothetical protein Egran_04770 [Elaphomyces granulatus]|uniref:HNH nuclease domain-containing protein n=1 Tax=Elaphomyces granulatus TaxID=519963 RepID=A0A232LTI0_9EURO|nr:hypothetical protein Egran_04770 [Elaphomyces granulatus]